MTETQRQIREYLAAIGKRGGLASRRELTRSHAKQIVAIPEAKRASYKLALAGGPTLRLVGDVLGREAGNGDRGSRKVMASSRPQTVKAQVTDSDPLVRAIRWTIQRKRTRVGDGS